MQKSSERVIEYDTDFDNDTTDFIRPGDKALGIGKPEADSQHDGGGRLSGFDVCGKQRGCLRDALRAEVADFGADRRNRRCADLFLPHTAEKKAYLPLRAALLLVLSGAVGNIIDRVCRGYVVDFFEFTFFDWPVFNVADIYVVAGVILMVLLIVFVLKDEDLDLKKKKDE